MNIAGFIVCLLLVSTCALAQSANDIIGVWHNQDKTAKIDINQNDGKFSGKIVWLKEPNLNGKPKLDIHNEEESLRSRPVMGLQILNDFEYDDDEWEDGTIYDPKEGETYSCVITKEGDKLNVRGFVGFSWIGRTAVWTKAE